MHDSQNANPEILEFSLESRKSTAHFAHWPARLPHHITPPAGSLWNNLSVNALRYPDKAALRFFDQSISYSQLLQKSERLAQILCGLEAKKGDRIVVCMQNCPQLVISHFAILRLDAVVVPVNPMNKAEELKHYITWRQNGRQRQMPCLLSSD
jgi:fatty-acyl-CoA synthase